MYNRNKEIREIIDEPKKFFRFWVRENAPKDEARDIIPRDNGKSVAVEWVGVVDKAVLSEWKEKAYSSNPP